MASGWQSASGWQTERSLAWLGPRDAPRAVVWLHDANGRLPEATSELGAALASGGLCVVAPLAHVTWWPDDSAANPAAAAIASLREVSADRPLALAGDGAGGHAALRLAYQRPREFTVVAAWRPAIDCYRLLGGRMLPPQRDDESLGDAEVAALRSAYRDAEAARQDSAVLHIHPLNWPRWQRFDCPRDSVWWDGADRLRMKLQSLGVPHEADLESSGDTDHAVRFVEWIAQSLDAIRRAM